MADPESPDGPPGAWAARVEGRPPPDPTLGGPGFAALIAAFRDLQHAFSGAGPLDGETAALQADVEALTARLRAREAPEFHTPAGGRHDLPGRGHPLLPPFVTDSWSDERVDARVTFGRFQLGGNGAVHGGVLPLLFDEVLGRLANSGRTVARTAYLTVNFRHITRIGVEHTLVAELDRIDGRKRHLRGVLRDPTGRVVSDAEGLFVELRPDQP